MPPKPFYEVNSQTYLFAKTVEKPEEKVRQWVLFELMSTYGIPINNIQIERPVKVGTRTHFADIVILRENAPYVVIECKKWDDKKKKQGMLQALSYADASTMKARYAIYTNGDVWEVKRKMGDDWVDIPDMPKRIDDDYLVTLDELVRSMSDFVPAFYWLSQTVPASSAGAYFSCLQRIFNGAPFPLNNLDKNLCFGTDNLLRVICAKGDHPNYLHEKMVAACKTFSKYFADRLGDKTEYDLRKDDLWQLTVDLKLRFEQLVANSQDLQSEEVIFIRFIATAIQYLAKQNHLKGKKEYFVDVPATLTKEFQDLLARLFLIHLGVSFPDPILVESFTHLRSMTFPAWEQFKERE